MLADSRHTYRWETRGITPVLCRGDLAFHTNCTEAENLLLYWARGEKEETPFCIDHLNEVTFIDIVRCIAEEYHLDCSIHNAFAGTEEGAMEQNTSIDGVDDSLDQALDMDPVAQVDQEAELLEAIPLPGHPIKERERRRKWAQLPRRARITIRRLHRNFKHLPKQSLIEMLRAATTPK